MIGIEDIRAARAYLGWSQDDTAVKTGLSVSTVRNFEAGGEISPRSTTTNVIRQAMERYGVEFLDGGGVRRRSSVAYTLQGNNSCDVLFDDMLHTVKEKGGEVIGVFRTRGVLARSCNVAQNDLGRLAAISNHAKIKCLLPEAIEQSLLSPAFQFRVVLQQHIGATSYFVYDNKHVTIIQEANSTFRFLVHTCINTALDHRKHFQTLWDMAPSVLVEYNREKSDIIPKAASPDALRKPAFVRQG